MKDIKAWFQMFLVAVFLIVVAWIIAQAVPQIQSAATLPAAIQAENARLLAEQRAASDFVALQVRATESAIENERTLARSKANAETIAAQGAADSARLTASTWQTLTYGVLALLAVGVVCLFALLFFQTHTAARTNRRVLELAEAAGATVITSDNATIQFPARGEAKQLGAPAEIPLAVVPPQAAVRRTK